VSAIFVDAYVVDNPVEWPVAIQEAPDFDPVEAWRETKRTAAKGPRLAIPENVAILAGRPEDARISSHEGDEDRRAERAVQVRRGINR
jgi:hypothetical protein